MRESLIGWYAYIVARGVRSVIPIVPSELDKFKVELNDIVDNKRRQTASLNMNFGDDSVSELGFENSMSTFQLELEVDREFENVVTPSHQYYESKMHDDSPSKFFDDFVLPSSSSSHSSGGGGGGSSNSSSSSDEHSLSFLQEYVQDYTALGPHSEMKRKIRIQELEKSHSLYELSTSDENSETKVNVNNESSDQDDGSDDDNDDDDESAKQEVLQIYASMDQALNQFNSMDFDDDLGVDKMGTGRVVDRQIFSSYSRDMTRVDDTKDA
jgi:hypothetical protein